MRNSNTDVIGVYLQDFTQIFSRARPLRATVRQTAKVMEHPLETGGVVADHRIINPIEIEFSDVMQAADYKNTYAEIEKYFDNATLLLVQTRTRVYANQLLAELSHDETAEMFDAIPIGLRFKEIIQFTNQSGLFVRDPTKGNTQQRGQQQGNSVIPTTPNPGF